jgi:hypothetical protein
MSGSKVSIKSASGIRPESARNATVVADECVASN